MALHEQSVGASDEWYTPPQVFDAMNVCFFMDVASPGADVVPWIPAIKHIRANSLSCIWAGFVWMNPPFGGRNGLVPWLDKFFAHGSGVALVPDRTSAPWWQDYAPKADAVLFVRKKLRFIRPDGTEGKNPAQGTSLFAAGPLGVDALQNAARGGLGLLLFGAPEQPPAADGLADCRGQREARRAEPAQIPSERTHDES